MTFSNIWMIECSLGAPENPFKLSCSLVDKVCLLLAWHMWQHCCYWATTTSALGPCWGCAPCSFHHVHHVIVFVSTHGGIFLSLSSWVLPCILCLCALILELGISPGVHLKHQIKLYFHLYSPCTLEIFPVGVCASDYLTCSCNHGSLTRRHNFASSEMKCKGSSHTHK